jgi:hypothetical protein
VAVSEHAAEAAALQRAILTAVAYADVFDYPLTVSEVHRYLIGLEATAEAVSAVVGEPGARPTALEFHQGYVTLAGRESLVPTRRRRAAEARRLWSRAERYGRAIASLPFVRMVAVTGALAMDNVERDDDIDYLVVTEPDRLWLCRALVVAIVRAAARRGDVVCPNYFLSERALELRERDLFTAHELAQMVPLCGLETYARMRRLNEWVAEFLPNAAGPSRSATNGSAPGQRLRGLAEAALRTPLGERIDTWERTRKMRKFEGQAAGHTEARFSADWCKGHFDDHGQRIMAELVKRLQALGVETT